MSGSCKISIHINQEHSPSFSLFAIVFLVFLLAEFHAESCISVAAGMIILRASWRVVSALMTQLILPQVVIQCSIGTLLYRVMYLLNIFACSLLASLAW